MSIIKTQREKDLAEAAGYYKAADDFVAANGNVAAEKQRNWLLPMLERAEALEKKHGVVPRGSLNVTGTQTSGAAANSPALQTARVRDLQEAAKLRQAARDFEARNDPQTVSRNRWLLESWLNLADELEARHQAPAQSLAASNAVSHVALNATPQSPPNVFAPAVPLAYDPAEDSSFDARWNIALKACFQGRIPNSNATRNFWANALAEDPETALATLNSYPPGVHPCGSLFFDSEGRNLRTVLCANDTANSAVGPSGLTATQEKICRSLGITAQQFMAAAEPEGHLLPPRRH